MSTHEWKGRTECAWCGKVLRDVPGPTSHGICRPCATKLKAENRAEIARKKLEQMEGAGDKKPTQENQGEESA